MLDTNQNVIQTIRVHSIPARAVHSHGSVDVSGINSRILGVITDTGITGCGEASPWPVFTSTPEGNAAALHVHLRPLLIGQDPIQLEKHLNTAGKVLVGHNEAKCALETALLDITGQICGLSIGELVGGRQRDDMAMSFSVANADFDKHLEDIAERWEDGVRLFKSKASYSERSFDVLRLEKLHHIYG
ncbi:MAG: muconate cycloisomerase [Granulosicoccus sp.]